MRVYIIDDVQMRHKFLMFQCFHWSCILEANDFQKEFHQVIRKMRNYYLLETLIDPGTMASSTHREQSRIYSYCLDNIRSPCHMFSHKMRLRHVFQKENAWWYGCTYRDIAYGGYVQRCLE